jgi:hypothetical protein
MLRYRTGAAGSSAAGHATAKYLTSETFKPENADLAKYYAGEQASMDERTGMDDLGQAIADGDLPFGEALDMLVSAHVRTLGLPPGDNIETYLADLETRITDRLLEKVDAADTREALAAEGGTVAKVRQDLNPGLARRLGISLDRPPTQSEIANLLAGLRADGQPIEGKQVQKPIQSVAAVFGLEEGVMPSEDAVRNVLAGRRGDGEVPMGADGSPLSDKAVQGARSRFLAAHGFKGRGEPTEKEAAHLAAGRNAAGGGLHIADVTWKLKATRQPVAFIDMIWSADKSVSVAWALAPTEAERSVIVQSHDGAVATAMAYVEEKLGVTRRGADGTRTDKGSVAWLTFNHYTSRPTAEIIRKDEEGREYTEFEEVPLKTADPQLHTHAPMLNAVFTDSGHIGAIDKDLLDGMVKEFGRVYQAALAQNLREHGITVELDKDTGAAKVVGVPDRVRDHFSKRTRDVHAAARQFAQDAGQDWESLSGEQQLGLLRRGVEATRNRKNDKDGPSDFAEWRKQAVNEIAYQHRSVLRPDEVQPKLTDVERHQVAYTVSLNILEETLSKKATLNVADFREAACSGLVEAGLGDKPGEDIKAIMEMYRIHGVRQDGQMTSIAFGKDASVRGKERWSITTAAHEVEEIRVVDLAKQFSVDTSPALSKAGLEKAKRDFLKSRPHIDPNGASWREQSTAIDRLAGYKFSVAIGAAGVGKTTLLTPLVSAAKAENRQVYGLAISWKAAAGLRDAGVSRGEFSAISPFLKKGQKGRRRHWTLDKNAVVIIDELSQVGRSDMLKLMDMQQKHGFTLLAVGDSKQCQAVESGPTISLLQDTLGNAIPEVVISNRQRSEREKEIVKLFRDGQAGEAIAMKREDGTASLVAGGRQRTIDRVATLWRERIEARGDDPDFKLSISAPTNVDAHQIGIAVRKQMREMGRLGAEDHMVTIGLRGEKGLQQIALAEGDRVRLFNRVWADKTHFASNGDAVTVLAVNENGFRARNDRGVEADVGWESLRWRQDEPIRLAYGYAMTVDASQGITSDEHIDALPEGSRVTHGLKGHTAESRQRDTTWLVVNEAEERRQIASRIPLNEFRPIREEDIWKNVATNLSRQPIKEGSLEFLKRGSQIIRGTTIALPTAMEAAERAGQGRSAFDERTERMAAELAAARAMEARQANLDRGNEAGRD